MMSYRIRSDFTEGGEDIAALFETLSESFRSTNYRVETELGFMGDGFIEFETDDSLDAFTVLLTVPGARNL